MIKLSPLIQEQFQYLAHPPTHAKAIHVRHTFLPDDLDVAKHGLESVMPRKDQLEAVYAFGTIGDGGVFTVNNHVRPIHALVDLKDYTEDTLSEMSPANALENLETRKQLSMAAKALLGAGTVPTPGKPHVAKKSPSKTENDFSKFDLDVFLAHFYPELRGEPI